MRGAISANGAFKNHKLAHFLNLIPFDKMDQTYAMSLIVEPKFAVVETRHLDLYADLSLRMRGRMTKPDTEGKVLLGNVVRPFLDAGGTLRYHPIRDDESGKTHWLVFGVRSDGSESQVFISRNGEPKRIRSANAVLSYHQSMFPSEGGVFIPWLPAEKTEETISQCHENEDNELL